jgi:hypothetical protein
MSNRLTGSNKSNYQDLKWGDLNYFFDWSIVPVKAKVYQILDYKKTPANHNPYENMSPEEKYIAFLSWERKYENFEIYKEDYRNHLDMLGISVGKVCLYHRIQKEVDKVIWEAWRFWETIKLLSEVNSVVFFNPYLWFDSTELPLYNDELRALKYRGLISFDLYKILDAHLSEADSRLLACS